MAITVVISIYEYTPCQVGKQYTAFLIASGGYPPYTFNVLDPLPDGLFWQALTGCISGVPKVAGPVTFTVEAKDGQRPGFQVSGSNDVTITVAPDPTGGGGMTVTADSASLPLGVDVVAQVTVTGGTGPYTYSAVGLPAGVVVDPATGTITGKPTTEGTTEATFTVTDSTTATASITRTYTVYKSDGYGSPLVPELPGPGVDPIISADEGFLRWTQLRKSSRRGLGMAGLSVEESGVITPGNLWVVGPTGGAVDGGLPISNIMVKSIGATFNGGGSALTAGMTAPLAIKDACTITRWRIMAVDGTATIKVWVHASGAIPDATDSINTDGVSISSGTDTGWQTTLTDFNPVVIPANSVVGIHLEAVSGATQVIFQMEVSIP